MSDDDDAARTAMPSSLARPSREVPVRDRVDVLVVGGGVGRRLGGDGSGPSTSLRFRLSCSVRALRLTMTPSMREAARG